MSAKNRGGGELNFHSVERGPSECFDLIHLNESEFALRTDSGFYVCAEKNGGAEAVANRIEPKEWESFKIIYLG